jgi:Ca2+-binding EF-hand superfamily protein
LYDKDKDGYITKNEMEKLSKNLSKEQIDKVFARFDADGDGKLSYAEFRKMMNK